MSAVVGMTDAHRRVYSLLVDKFPDGLTRDALRLHAGLDDRALRKTIEELRPVAATVEHRTLGRLIVGFDPALEVYTYAKDRQQADRILSYQQSRVEALLSGLLPQLEVARSFGHSPVDAAIQDRLLEAAPLLRDFR